MRHWVTKAEERKKGRKKNLDIKKKKICQKTLPPAAQLVAVETQETCYRHFKRSSTWAWNGEAVRCKRVFSLRMSREHSVHWYKRRRRQVQHMYWRYKRRLCCEAGHSRTARDSPRGHTHATGHMTGHNLLPSDTVRLGERNHTKTPTLTSPLSGPQCWTVPPWPSRARAAWTPCPTWSCSSWRRSWRERGTRPRARASGRRSWRASASGCGRRWGCCRTARGTGSVSAPPTFILARERQTSVWPLRIRLPLTHSLCAMGDNWYEKVLGFSKHWLRWQVGVVISADTSPLERVVGLGPTHGGLSVCS